MLHKHPTLLKRCWSQTTDHTTKSSLSFDPKCLMAVKVCSRNLIVKNQRKKEKESEYSAYFSCSLYQPFACLSVSFHMKGVPHNFYDTGLGQQRRRGKGPPFHIINGSFLIPINARTLSSLFPLLWLLRLHGDKCLTLSPSDCWQSAFFKRD